VTALFWAIVALDFVAVVVVVVVGWGAVEVYRMRK
jgi:hypothetical protein